MREFQSVVACSGFSRIGKLGNNCNFPCCAAATKIVEGCWPGLKGSDLSRVSGDTGRAISESIIAAPCKDACRNP